MLATQTSRLRFIPRLLVFLAAVYGLSWISGFPLQYDDEELPPASQRPKAATSPALHHVDNDQLIVSIRTTATDVYAKLPSLLLLTNPQDHDTLLCMGDLHMDVGPFHVHDVLDRLDEHLVTDNPDLARYRQQVAFARASVDVGAVKGKTGREEKDNLAMLDKYKVMHMLQRAWELRPDRKWYIFIDTDTYLVRSSLLVWLGQYDSSQPAFFANPFVADSPEPFALVGNTFILSAQAMRSLFVDRKDSIALWDARAVDSRSSSDLLYSIISNELGLNITTTWPLISGFHPSTVPYGPGFWCEQVLVMHSVPTDVASDVWRLERDRLEHQHVRDPLLFADLWTRFLQQERLTVPRDNWDNLSSGPEQAHWNILFEGVKSSVQPQDGQGRAANGEESWEACQEACNKHERCMQWSYSSVATPNYNENGATRCHVSTNMRVGGHKGPDKVKKEGTEVVKTWKSGWRKDNFEMWAKHQRCKGQQN